MTNVVNKYCLKQIVQALPVIKLNQPVTPGEINTAVGEGNYATKYVCILRLNGFEFVSNKNGRQIVSYTLVKEPDNVEDYRSGKLLTKSAKVSKKAPAIKRVIAKGASKFVSKKVVDKDAAEKFLTYIGLNKKIKSASKPSGYSVDPGFDSFEGPINLRDLGV